MQSADRFGPIKGLCPYKALIGLTQATGLAGGFDYLGVKQNKTQVDYTAYGTGYQVSLPMDIEIMCRCYNDVRQEEKRIANRSGL